MGQSDSSLALLWTRFISASFPVQRVGGSEHLELWVTADELQRFNRHIVGLIEVIHEFRNERFA